MPTYESELRFYLSNTWNFPESEVAFGNLGCAYVQMGLQGAANDMWMISGTINKDYDVPFYNVFQQTKSRGLMMINGGNYDQGFQILASSIPMMQRVLDCKVIHYKDTWNKEMAELKAMVANPAGMLVNELGRLYQLRMTLNAELSKAQDEKRRSEVIPSIQNNENQINNLMAFLNTKGIKVDFNAERALLSKLTGGR